MNLTHGKSPWKTVQHDGLRWMVRDSGAAWWFVRLPEREVFLLEPENVPAWARSTEPQMELLA